MQKQKLNSVTFHKAAQKIVDKYFGEIPDFEVRTSLKIKTTNNKTCNEFIVFYGPESSLTCDFEFWIFERSPLEALEHFEIEMMGFWNILIPEETSELISFDLLY